MIKDISPLNHLQLFITGTALPVVWTPKLVDPKIGLDSIWFLGPCDSDAGCFWGGVKTVTTGTGKRVTILISILIQVFLSKQWLKLIRCLWKHVWNLHCFCAIRITLIPPPTKKNIHITSRNYTTHTHIYIFLQTYSIKSDNFKHSEVHQMVTEHDHLPCPEDTALLGRGAKGGAWIAAAMGPPRWSKRKRSGSTAHVDGDIAPVRCKSADSAKEFTIIHLATSE
jgi:hypothetical protein